MSFDRDLIVLQRRIWSPSCRPAMAFLYKVRPLLSEDRSALATTAMAAASRSLPLNVSHSHFENHFVWHYINIAAHKLLDLLWCEWTTVHNICWLLLSLFSSGLSEHTQYELHLCWIRQWVGRVGQCVVELCCGAEKRRQQSNAVKGSTTVVADGIFILFYITLIL